MDNDAEMFERMGDHTTNLQMKHREFDQPVRSRTMVPGRRPLSLATLVLLLCCGLVRADILWTSASWECVCSDCQVCEEGPCCSDACTIAGKNVCVSTECTGQAACGLSSLFTGSKCFTSSRFQLSNVPTSGCVASTCDATICVGAATADTAGNKLAWGVPDTSSDSSSVTAHGVNRAPTTSTATLTDLAKLEAFNGTIFGPTGIGHATLRIASEQVASVSGPCSRSFDLQDCASQGFVSVGLKAFFYNTPNITGDPNQDADFICFPQLDAGFLCDSPDPQLAALCPSECVSDTALCPRCLKIPENTPLNLLSGAFIKGAIAAITPVPLQSQRLGTEDASTFNGNNILVVPVLVADPFGDVQLAPFWQVVVDALPDACPNFLQLRNDSAGSPSIEVAAFGTDEVDVHDIDPDRVRGIVPGTGEAVAPISIDFADIGAPGGSGLDCACGSSVPDGKPDMVLRFPAAAWLEAWKTTSQLGNQIAVSFRRQSDDAAAETADCVTLEGCPETDHVAPAVALTAPTGTQQLPIAVKFTAVDADGFEGDIVAERILLDGCPVLDGDLVGNRDGVLSAEEATLDTRALCGVARACPRNNFKRPLLTVEAVDCNGNTGSSTVRLRSKFHVDGSICKEFGNWHDGQDGHQGERGRP